MNSTAWPKRSRAARWLKLYSGPRKATLWIFCRAREPLMISRKIARMVTSASGPLLADRTFARTSSSRAGEKTSPPFSVLTLPISAARAARSLISLRICRSSLSIWTRKALRSFEDGRWSPLRVMARCLAEMSEDQGLNALQCIDVQNSVNQAAAAILGVNVRRNSLIPIMFGQEARSNLPIRRAENRRDVKLAVAVSGLLRVCNGQLVIDSFAAVDLRQLTRRRDSLGIATCFISGSKSS